MRFKLKKGETYLFATDLDGTFLTDRESMHIKNYEAVREIKKQGHKFVITTGRAWWWSKRIYDQVESIDVSIHFSGAQIHLPGDKSFKEFHRYITKEDVIEVARIIGEDKWEEIEAIGRKHQAQFNNLKDLNDLFFDVYELAVSFKYEDSNQIYEHLKELFEDKFVIRHWVFPKNKKSFIVFTSKDTNKGNALKYVASYYKIPQSNVIYFGDNVNDIEALAWSGMSFAVKNGIDEAKRVAKSTLELTNNDGAVAKKILELLKDN